MKIDHQFVERWMLAIMRNHKVWMARQIVAHGKHVMAS